MFSEKATSIKDLNGIASKLINRFENKKVFALFGKMGAGKTTFIQAICRYLGSTDNITSPTFALVNEYESKFGRVYHFDFYRIKEMEEAFDIGYEDYLYSGNYCFIEWPEKIEPLLPANIVEVKIEVTNNENRIISADLC